MIISITNLHLQFSLQVQLNHYDVNLEGQIIGEDVELHPEEKYVQIQSQAIPKRTPLTIIKDFERVKIFSIFVSHCMKLKLILFLKIASIEMNILFLLSRT